MEYTKTDLVCAYLRRFVEANLDFLELAKNADKFYDEVGAKTFRKYACVDAEQMKLYKEYVTKQTTK